MFNKKKHDKINVDETINKVEKWFTDYQKNVYSTYKALNPDGKSLQLTLSTQFHDILKKMHKDSESCKLLNGLLTSNKLKIKSSYLANNNINALAANIGSDGDATLSYADIKTVLQKEIGTIRNYTKLTDIEKSLHLYKHSLKAELPIIYDAVYSTAARRKDLFYKDTSVHIKHLQAFDRMLKTHDSITRDLILSPGRERYGADSISTLLAYISIGTSTNLLVNRATKCMINFLQDSNLILTPSKWFTDEYPQHKAIKKAFEERLVTTNIMWNVLRDSTCYFEKNAEGLLEILDLIKEKTTPFNKILEKIEEYNVENIINMLAVVESVLKFFNLLLEFSEAKSYENGGDSKTIFQILKREDAFSYEFNRLAKSLGVITAFSSLSYMYIGVSDFNHYLDKNYKDYLCGLYKSNHRESCKIGKISSKLYNRHFTAVEVEEFASLFKKQMIVDSVLHDIRIVEGSLISYYYNSFVYAKRKRVLTPNMLRILGPISVVDPMDNLFINTNMEGGSLEYSCMRHPSRLTRTKLYADNPNTYKMLIALDTDGRLKARAVLEYHKDGKIYIDRVYASNEKVRLEMFTWAEQRGFISLHRTNGSYKADLKYTSDANLILELEKPIRSETPYLDSMKIQSHVGIMAKKDLDKAKKIKLENKILENRIKNNTRQDIRLLDFEIAETFRKTAVAKDYKLSKEYDIEVITSMETEHVGRTLRTDHVWGVNVEVPARDVNTLQISFKKAKKNPLLPVLEKRIKIKVENKGLNVQDVFLRTVDVTILPGVNSAA